MKTLHLVIIIIFSASLVAASNNVFADNSGKVEITRMEVEPSTIKVNDTFSIDVTILNNSTYPIYLTSGSCTPAFSVAFDTHAKQVYPNIACTTEAILQKVDPQSQVTVSNANKPGVIYQAVQSGTATVTITIPYFAKNQTATDYSNIYYNTSKSFQFTILNQSSTLPQHQYGGDGTTVTITLDPLDQLKSGVTPKDVKCKEGLQLVIKTEDGTPACLRPDHAYILIYRGWAKEFIQSVTWTNQSTCEGTEVPSGDYRKNIFPVLIMSPNSTATVCVTYNFMSDWQLYHNKDVYPHGILETCCFVHMGGYSSPVSPNKFEVLANPPLFNVTGVNNGSKISVTYKIYAKPDSKGFYNTSVPFDGCLSYPLAVGYDPSEVDATKFHADFGIPCFNTIEDVDSVNIVSGMTYKEVQFP